MSNIVNEHVENYIRSLVNEKDEFFLELEKYAEENHVPIIHKEVKKLLEFIVQSTNSKSVLEIGTAIGYSAGIFARCLNHTGRVVSIERREDYYNLAKENLKRLNSNTEIDLRLGDAKDVLIDIEEKFDIIFIDAAKGHYRDFFDKCYEKLNEGGVIISDNVLYKGMIASDEYVLRRKITIVKRMRTYLDYISDHSGLTTTILPMSDGIALSYKNGGKDE